MNGSYLADLANQVLFLVVLANSLNLLLGVAGQLSMATAAFYGVGAYTCAIMTAQGMTLGGSKVIGPGWPFLGGFVSAVVVSTVAGCIVALPAARRVRGEYLILLTIAFQFLFSTSATTFISVTGGPNGMEVPPISLGGVTVDSTDHGFWLILAFALITALECWWIAASPYGRLLRAIREDEEVVQALGKGTVWPKSLTFAMTAGMAGATGALSAAYMLFVAPATYNLDLAVLTAACVALGGPGNVLGSTIAAVIIGGLRPLLENIGGLSSEASVPWQAVIFGCMLVLGIRFRPQGLVPERGTGLFRTTLRERISVPQQEARPIEVEAVGQRPPSVREKAVIEFPPRQFARAMRPAGGIAEFPPGEPAEERKIPIVEVRGISKRFGGLQAVDDFSLDLHAGEVVALIGPNGAGKTTVFDLLTARLRPDTGDARLRGKSIVNMSARAIARSGMVRYFQNVRVFGGLTALENVAMGIPRQPGESLARTLTMPLGVWCHERQVREQAIEHLEYVGAADLRNNLVRDLAFGQQKLVAFARLLATGGNVLLLDEPAAGVDPRSAEQIIELVRSLAVARKAICIVEHSVYVVSELANRVIFMDNGRIIAEGTVGEVTSRHDLIDLYFGT